MKRKILFVCMFAYCILFFSIQIQAKGKEFKFGKVNPLDLSSTVCPIDSNAHAYYCFDVGESYYSYVNGFKIYYSRHFMIKILDKSGLDNATISIPYYESGGVRMLISNLKAYTYNMENGKIVKTELERKNIYDEETSKYWRQKKFALPNVKEGSLIEVSYSIQSPFDGILPGWKLQYYIPVLYSHYKVTIPEYYKFNQTHRGYVLAKTTDDFETGMLVFKDGSTTNYSSKVYEYEIENVPAFPVAEELTTPNNYMASIEFELASIEVPGAIYNNYSSSWNDINKLFLDDVEFGDKLKLTGFLKDSANVIVSTNKTDMERIQAAFKMIKRRMKWNGKADCVCSQSLRKTFDTGLGNSADINLLLVALLREVGLDASPVVLSTRSNGIIHPANPSMDQLNYAIAMCREDGGVLLMDATDKYSEINILPDRCLNDKGWVVDKNFSGWEPLLKGKKSKESALYNLSLNKDGLFTGDINISYQEHKALQKRNQIKDFESTDKYVQKLQESNNGLVIKNYSISNLDTTNEDLKMFYHVEISDNVESAGDLLYFKPLLFEAYEKNPLTLEKREYPVEYPTPKVESVVISITIPDGYKIESIPQPLKLTALDNICQYSYKSGINENKLTILSTLQIGGTIFPGTQYNDLKSFYEQVVKKQLEQVVLKKI